MKLETLELYLKRESLMRPLPALITYEQDPLVLIWPHSVSDKISYKEM